MTSLQETALYPFDIESFFFKFAAHYFQRFQEHQTFFTINASLESNIGHSGEVYVIIKLFNQRATGAWHN